MTTLGRGLNHYWKAIENKGFYRRGPVLGSLIPMHVGESGVLATLPLPRQVILNTYQYYIYFDYKVGLK